MSWAICDSRDLSNCLPEVREHKAAFGGREELSCWT